MLTLTYPAIGLRPAALSFPELGNGVADAPECLRCQGGTGQAPLLDVPPGVAHCHCAVCFQAGRVTKQGPMFEA